MRNLVFLSYLILALVVNACGKKEDSPPQFSLGDLRKMDETVIDRNDENSGPTVMVDGDGGSIESFDKKLICGPVQLQARRALKTDAAFLTFKLSEAEFHGLNLLPMRTSCKLQIVAAKGNGSTMTRTFPVDLKFSTHAPIDIKFEFINSGEYTLVDPTKVTLISYTIKNTLPYPVPFIFRPSRSAGGVPMFGNYVGPKTEFANNLVEFDPINLEVLGSADSLYRFKVQPGDTVKIKSSFKIPTEWMGNKRPCADSGAGLINVQLTKILFYVAHEPVNSLVQAQGYEFGPNDAATDAGFGKGFQSSYFREMRYIPWVNVPPACIDGLK